MTLGRSGTGTAVACVVAALTCALHCSGNSFSSDRDPATGGATSGGGTSGGASGGSATGGSATGGSATGGSATGGSAGTSGTAGSTSSGGRAGASGGSDTGGSDSGGQGDGGTGGDVSCDEATTCPRGHYCGSSGICVSCSDIVSLDDPGAARFGVAEPLSVINDSAGEFFLRTPRAFGSGNALLYVRDFFGGEIWLTGDAEADIGAPLPSPINEPDFLEGSPLWLGGEASVFGGLNFVFNRAADRNSPYELSAARLTASGIASDLMPLPAPFNPTPSLSESVYALAISEARAWWTVNRDLMLNVQLLTAPVDEEGPPSVVPLRLSEACPLREVDFSPWVTPDGKLLFVNATERNSNCEQLAGQSQDIVMFRVNEAGQATGPAFPLSSVNHPEISEIDASLSPDMCTLYFVTPVADKPRIMRARRSG